MTCRIQTTQQRSGATETSGSRQPSITISAGLASADEQQARRPRSSEAAAILSLPSSLLSRVVQQLSAKDLAAMMLVCHSWHRAGECDEVWEVFAAHTRPTQGRPISYVVVPPVPLRCCVHSCLCDHQPALFLSSSVGAYARLVTHTGRHCTPVGVCAEPGSGCKSQRSSFHYWSLHHCKMHHEG